MLTVTSTPLLDIVGGSKFVTDAEFVVRPDEGGCKVRQSASACSYSGSLCVLVVFYEEMRMAEFCGWHAGWQVFAKVICAAAGPWGLIGTIENIMAEQAAESVRDFLHFCVQRCMTHDAEQAVDVQPDFVSYGSDLESSYELFQDALETASQAYSDTPHQVVHAPGDMQTLIALQCEVHRTTRGPCCCQLNNPVFSDRLC